MKLSAAVSQKAVRQMCNELLVVSVCPVSGSQQERALHRLQPGEPRGEDLRRSPQVHAARSVRRARPPGALDPQQIQRSEGGLHHRGPRLRHPEGELERTQGLRQRQARQPHLDQRQHLELHLYGQGKGLQYRFTVHLDIYNHLVEEKKTTTLFGQPVNHKPHLTSNFHISFKHL